MTAIDPLADDIRSNTTIPDVPATAPDQQTRAEALAIAVRHLAATGELPEAVQQQPRTVLGLADVYAGYIHEGSRP